MGTTQENKAFSMAEKMPLSASCRIPDYSVLPIFFFFRDIICAYVAYL